MQGKLEILRKIDHHFRVAQQFILDILACRIDSIIYIECQHRTMTLIGSSKSYIEHSANRELPGTALDKGIDRIDNRLIGIFFMLLFLGENRICCKKETEHQCHCEKGFS